jgi:dTMP kinase
MQAESSTTRQRGLFIVLEGLDRCGKSTQVDQLVAHLNSSDRQARLQKFPGGCTQVGDPALQKSYADDADRTTAIGKMIDSYLQSKSELDDRAIHLLFSANRWECA